MHAVVARHLARGGIFGAMAQEDRLVLVSAGAGAGEAPGPRPARPGRDKYPTAIRYIIGQEFCERFSYYGCV